MDIITEIKKKISIIKLAEDAGLEIKKKSSRIHFAICCFHDEEKPSLTFYTDNNRFHCYGCGASGDIIDFYARIKKISNRQAIKDLNAALNSPALQKSAEEQNMERKRNP